MKEFALALSAMTASHHRWPMKPPLEPAAIVRRRPLRHATLTCGSCERRSTDIAASRSI
jgi:hypothetical protein